LSVSCMNPEYYLPDWMVHPTILDVYSDLFSVKRAEHAGRALGWRPAEARRVGVLWQRDLFERSEIEVRCIRCEAPQPKKTPADNNTISNNDIKGSNNPISIKDGIEDANHNGRIDGDNGDGKYDESEIWKETDPNNIDTDGDTFSDKDEKEWGYNPLKKDSDGDGLTDIEEDKNKNGKYDPENNETDVLKLDTDKDGLQDKLELDGWTVCIRFGSTKEELMN